MQGRGSRFGPRGWAVMQEAAAATFRRRSRASGRNRSIRKALTLQAFPQVHAMADTGRKCAVGAWGVASNGRQSVLRIGRSVSA